MTAVLRPPEMTEQLTESPEFGGYDGMASVIPIMVNLGMAGAPVVTHDIGEAVFLGLDAIGDAAVRVENEDSDAGQPVGTIVLPPDQVPRR